MNIICLYWVGEFRGRNFTLEDVERLYQSVRKQIDRPFTFYCLTNTEEDLPDYIHRIPLIHDWPGWWAKVELHRSDLPSGRNLYLDLDSHIVGSLQPILDYPGDLVMFNTRAIRNPQDKGLVTRYQAAVMLFDTGTPIMKELYERFSKNSEELMEKYRSEQDVMGDWFPEQPTFPNNWLMKLNDCRVRKTIPKECIVITGQPRVMSFRAAENIDWIRV